MKSLKKAFSFLLIVAMLCSSTAFAISFPDVESNVGYAEAVDVLSAFKIINGYEDGTFRPDNDVTRAEFTAMLVRSMNLSGIGSANPADLPFRDLGAAEWAISDIHTAYTKGIINGMGDGTFAPNKNVTYEQAIKMVVCALGYELMAKDSVGEGVDVYPAGYINVGNDLGLTLKINGVMGANMKRWQNAQLIYNSFLVDIMTPVTTAAGVIYRMEPGKNLLSEYLKMYKSTGVVMADNKSTISEDNALVRAGELSIYDNTAKRVLLYQAGDIDVSGLVGKGVTFYYKKTAEGDIVLTYIASNMKEESELELDSNLIVEAEGSYSGGYTIDYFEKAGDKKTATLKIAPNARFLLNNVEMTSAQVEAFDFVDDEYTITLLASSNTGSYDIIRISKYETYVVKSVSASTMTIIDRFKTTQNSFKVNENDALTTYEFKDANGNAKTFDSISAWDVLSIKAETTINGRTTVEVIICDDPVSGEVNGIGDDYIEIDEVEYPLSTYFINHYLTSSDGGRVYSGDTGNFYRDKDGKIVAVSKETDNASTYGFIAAASYESNSGRTRMAFMSSSMSTNTYTAKKVKIDGIPYTAEEVPDVLQDIVLRSDEAAYINLDDPVINSNICSQVVKIGRNASGEINTIDTVYLSNFEAERSGTDYLTASTLNDAETRWDYTSSNRTFTSDDDETFKVDANTMILTLPEDRSEYSKYGKRELKNFDNYTRYTLEAYDIDRNTSVAKVLIVYAENIDALVNVNSPVFIVTRKIDQTRNSAGDVVEAAEGYISSKSSAPSQIETIYCSATNVLDGVEIGDAIRYGVDENGAILDGTVQVVFSPSALDPLGFDKYSHISSSDDGKTLIFDVTSSNQTSNTVVGATFRMFAGYAYSIDADNKNLTVAICDDVEDCEEARKVSFDVRANTRFIIFDTEAAESVCVQYQEDKGTDFQLEILQTFANNSEDAFPVFVHSSGGTMRTVYIVK